MIEWVHNHRLLLLCIVLAIITFVVYLPVRNHEFVRYDDDTYVTHNPNVKTGLSLQGIKWAFTAGYAANWHPLTWLSHQLDCQLFDLNSGEHHLVNVVFHVANTVLLFIVLSRMTGLIWPSVFVAGLFALHPLHVESVAWVAERKDVLSTLFWLLTMLAYVRYVEGPSAGRYVTAIVLFIVGLMSKPMLVTLPIVLVLLDYWPLNRFNSRFSILNSFIEKVPFFLLSIVSSIVTFVVQQKAGTMPSIYAIPLKGRIVNAICSYPGYIGKMIWPSRLAALYPYTIGQIPTARAVIYAAALVLITVFLIYQGRKYRYLIVGWFWYLVTLVPVIGIVQVGAQAMADRYTYVPLTGLFIIIAFGAAEVTRKIPFGKFIVTACAIVVLFGCAMTASAQMKHWKDSFTLFDHTLAVTENNYVMLNNYANVVSEQGRPAEAVKYFVEAMRLLPNSADIHNNYANTLKDLGRVDEAVEEYRIALKLNPSSAMPHYNLAVELAGKGDYNEAIEQYKIAVNLKPDFVEAYCNIGCVLSLKGQPAQAIEYFEKGLRIEPNDILAHGQLAMALANTGRIEEAIEHCRIVLAARPNDVEMHTNLGILLERQGKIDEAIEHYRKALQIDPNHQKARDNLNALTQRRGPSPK
ncbi:MAG: tetratricopeptide repeat protein [Sedimentisphaerales bacterium]|jgi:tetratricopeptide (TPR) repeat protein